MDGGRRTERGEDAQPREPTLNPGSRRKPGQQESQQEGGHRGAAGKQAGRPAREGGRRQRETPRPHRPATKQQPGQPAQPGTQGKKGKARASTPEGHQKATGPGKPRQAKRNQRGREATPAGHQTATGPARAADRAQGQPGHPLAPVGAQDQLGIAQLQQCAKTLPQLGRDWLALRRVPSPQLPAQTVCSRPAPPNQSHGLLTRPAPVLERHRDKGRASKVVPTSLGGGGVRGTASVQASPAPQAGPVTRVRRRDRDVHVKSLARSGIGGYNVKHSLLSGRAACDVSNLPIPFRDMLFRERWHSCAAGPCPSTMVPQPVMPFAKGPPNVALACVVTPGVQGSTAQRPILPTMLASGAGLAHWQQQPVPQGENKVPIGERREPAQRRKQEGSSPWAPMGSDIRGVLVGQGS